MRLRAAARPKQRESIAALGRPRKTGRAVRLPAHVAERADPAFYTGGRLRAPIGVAQRP